MGVETVMSDKFAIGDRVRIERERLKLTQVQLAEKINMSAKEISNIECGKTEPKLQTTKAIARTLGVSVDYLISVSSEFGAELYVSEVQNRIMQLDKKDAKHILAYIKFYLQQKEDELLKIE